MVPFWRVSATPEGAVATAPAAAAHAHALRDEIEPLLQCEDRFPDCVHDADDDEDGLGISALEFYEWDRLRYVLSMLGAMLTAGLLLLVFRWLPVLALRATHRRSHSRAAQRVLVHSTDGQRTVVEMCPEEDLGDAGWGLPLPRSFYFRNLRYFERPHVRCGFAPMAFKACQPYCALLHSSRVGLSPGHLHLRRGLLGKNLAEVPVKSHVHLLLDEVLHPFYIFQVWSVIVWYLEPYILYAMTIAGISLLSAAFSLITTRRNLLGIQAMAQVKCDVTVRRRGDGGEGTVRQRVCSTELVPGDVVEIEDQMVFPCDMVVCSGAVVVNEAMLSGESMPVLKSAVPGEGGEGGSAAEAGGEAAGQAREGEGMYDSERDKRHTVFCGTKALDARPSSGVLGVVLRTGFATAKGRLVRSILYPRPANFKLYADALAFVAVMAGLAISGFLWSVEAFVRYHVKIRDVILNACDIVTVAVPPALPAAMTIGTEFAIERLRRARIFCISPNRLNMCGQLDIVCFDKTGTLTEEGVDVRGVIPALETGGDVCLGTLVPAEQAPGRLLQCLAVCHTLTAVDGELIGDPLDLKMFAATGWQLHEPPAGLGQASGAREAEDALAPPRVSPPGQQAGVGGHGGGRGNVRSEERLGRGRQESRRPEDGGLAIIKRFDFSSEHQRMSVLARSDHERGSHVFLKGAPEVVRELCDPDSVPGNFSEVVQAHSRQGLRLLACAHAYDPAMTWHKAARVSREQAERGLRLLGILLLENPVKAESAGMIGQLNVAGIRCAMVTGDHVSTAVSVSRQCSIIRPGLPVLVGEAVEDERTGSGRKEIRFRLLEPQNGWGKHLAPLILEEGKLGENGDISATDLVGFLEATRSKWARGRDSQREGTGEGGGGGRGGHDGEIMDFEVAITGPAFAQFERSGPGGKESVGGDAGGRADLLAGVTEVAKVYARMSPDHKQTLVDIYAADHGLTVGMCGDGANDCGALKAAHVGLSLSDAEASIAAPFTSSVPNISPLLTLMREGRAALVTSIACFKFMALYSGIQFVTVLRLYQVNSNMSDLQYLWIDLCLIFPLAITMGRTDAFPQLSPKRPHGRLISFAVLASVLGQTAVAACFQALAAWWTLQMTSFRCDDSCPPPTSIGTSGLYVEAGEAAVCEPKLGYKMPPCCLAMPLGCPTRPIAQNTDANILSVESTSAFLFSQFQYLAVVLAFNRAAPFRGSMLTNRWFTALLVVVTCVSLLLLLLHDSTITALCQHLSTLQLSPFPNPSFKQRLLGLALLNSAVALSYESLVENEAGAVAAGQRGAAAACARVVAVLGTMLLSACLPIILIPGLRYTS